MTKVTGLTAHPKVPSDAAGAKPSPWLLCFAPRPAARVRLFCFSLAGGGAAMYRAWLDALPTTIELCAVQLPGRESRLREPAFTSMQRIVEAVVPELVARIDRPYALFGHSMGALVAFETARALRSMAALPQPVRLLVSGRRAPHLPETEAPMHPLSDTDFVAEIGRRYGGIPDEVLRHRELLELLLPGLRADITAIETHSFVPGSRLGCPFTVFGGEADARATREQLAAWHLHCDGGTRMRMRMFRGSHFYLNDPAVRAELISEVARDVLPVHGPSLGG
jgi:medium-chain acyl-[acyl-carrier-protein] hydrolase